MYSCACSSYKTFLSSKTSDVSSFNRSGTQASLFPAQQDPRTAMPGRDLTMSCLSRGAQPAPDLTITINGRNVSEFSRTRVEALPAASGAHDGAIVAREG